MNLMTEQEKSPNLKKRENILKKITNRLSGMCGTVTKDLAFVSSKFQKERRRAGLKEYMKK